jgi:hypothetical protein
VEVDDAGGETECLGSGAEQRGGEKFGVGVCGANSREVVERAKRNPIVEGEEQHDESLQGEQRVKGVGVHAETDYTGEFLFLFSRCEVGLAVAGLTGFPAAESWFVRVTLVVELRDYLRGRN